MKNLIIIFAIFMSSISFAQLSEVRTKLPELKLLNPDGSGYYISVEQSIGKDDKLVYQYISSLQSETQIQIENTVYRPSIEINRGFNFKCLCQTQITKLEFYKDTQELFVEYKNSTGKYFATYFFEESEFIYTDLYNQHSK